MFLSSSDRRCCEDRNSKPKLLSLSCKTGLPFVCSFNGLAIPLSSLRPSRLRISSQRFYVDTFHSCARCLKPLYIAFENGQYPLESGILYGHLWAPWHLQKELLLLAGPEANSALRTKDRNKISCIPMSVSSLLALLPIYTWMLLSHLVPQPFTSKETHRILN